MIVVHGRQSSHYTRLVRVLALELGVEVELAPIHDLLATDPATFAGNPALKLPALRDGDTFVWGSANACRWLARRSAAGEDAVFWPEDATDPLLMNAHEIVAHAMAAEVEVVFHEIVAKRPPDAASIKRRESLVASLHWLDAHFDEIQARLPRGRICWIEVALLCLLEHLPFRNPIDLGRPLLALQRFVVAFGFRESAQATRYRFDPAPTPTSPAGAHAGG